MTPMSRTGPPSRGSATISVIVKFGMALAVLALLFVTIRIFDLQAKLQLALDWVEGLGAIGPIVYIMIYVLACTLFISGAALTIGAGAAFGLLPGTIYVSIGSTLGATAAFLVGRYLARDRVAKRIEGNARFTAIDQAVADEGWKIVGLTRLSPVFPFVLLNYVFSLTKVRLRHYVIASWAGMLPGTVLYVYIGYLGREAAAGAGSTSLAQWILADRRTGGHRGRYRADHASGETGVEREAR